MKNYTYVYLWKSKKHDTFFWVVADVFSNTDL